MWRFRAVRRRLCEGVYRATCLNRAELEPFDGQNESGLGGKLSSARRSRLPGASAQASVEYSKARFTGSQSLAMQRSTTTRVLLLLAFAGSTLTGCARNGRFGEGDGANAGQNCTLGTLGCLCDSWGGCALGLVCVRDRCEEAGGESPGTNTSTLAPDFTSGTSEPQQPSAEPGEPEPTDSGAGPTSQVSTSESSGASTSSSTSSSSSSSSAGANCADGLVNAKETDIDCGGPACPACQNGRRCVVNLDCISERCKEGICVVDTSPPCNKNADCRDNNVCTQDQCIDARCQNTPVADGTSCNDRERCTLNDRCLAGRCEGQDTRVFFETFSDPATNVFELDYNPPERLWQAGTARASACSDPGYFEDPSNDHTQDMANGVMGVDIGGCSQDAQMRQLDCAWTRYFDVSFFEDDLHFSFWRRIATPGYEAGRDGMRVRNFQYFRLQGDSTLYPMKSGWPDKINDRRWTFDDWVIPRHEVTAPISIGICYRRLGGSGSFAGWSVDDVKLREVGCEPKG